MRIAIFSDDIELKLCCISQGVSLDIMTKLVHRHACREATVQDAAGTVVARTMQLVTRLMGHVTANSDGLGSSATIHALLVTLAKTVNQNVNVKIVRHVTPRRDTVRVLVNGRVICATSVSTAVNTVYNKM